MRKLSVCLCGLTIAMVQGQGTGRAQTPDLRPGNFELGLYTGASYGVDSFRWMTGANLSYSLPKLLLPYAEWSYFPGIQRNFDNGVNAGKLTAKITDFHGGVHIRFIGRESRVVPYGVVGFGALSSRSTGQSKGKLSGLSSNQDIRSTDPAVNFGAGLRVYHASFFGYRAEFKAYRLWSSQFSKIFTKSEGGIFFQFGGR